MAKNIICDFCKTEIKQSTQYIINIDYCKTGTADYPTGATDIDNEYHFDCCDDCRDEIVKKTKTKK